MSLTEMIEALIEGGALHMDTCDTSQALKDAETNQDAVDVLCKVIDKTRALADEYEDLKNSLDTTSDS